MAALDGPRRDPLSGTLTSAVVLLHGYGADGHDLIGLADAWRRALPDTLFLAPDAPDRLAHSLGGRQWFPLTLRDPTEYWRGVTAAGPQLDTYLDDVLGETGLPDGRVALVGFSQGTMMALHVGLRRGHAPAAIVGYSGRLAGPEKLTSEITCMPPTLLVHGSLDDLIPIACLAEAAESLSAAGVPVTAVEIPELGHGIDPDGLDLGVRFLAQAFGVE